MVKIESMATQRVTVHFDAQVIEKTKRLFVSPSLDIACDTKAHRGRLVSVLKR